MADAAKPVGEVRVAILDLYNGEPNQGMRCIREILEAADGAHHGWRVRFEVLDVRRRGEAPDLEFDAYISTGGPGSPFDGEGSPWEKRYFSWLDDLWLHNSRRTGASKHAIFICHSFQMMCHHFRLGEVTMRKSDSFGVFPVHMTEAGRREPLFATMENPFYAADFRHWQVTRPDARRMSELGARILALEKHRPHVKLERALMAIRLSPEVVGVQFHPEADRPGMLVHFADEKRRAQIIREYGQAKYERIIQRLDDPDYLERTHRAVLPGFIRSVVDALVAGGTDASGAEDARRRPPAV